MTRAQDVRLDRKLDNGMTVREALQRARTWWDSTGRFGVKRQSNEIEEGRKVAVSSGAAPGIVVAGNRVPVLASAILRGLPWDMLTKDDKLVVVRAWYGAFKLEHDEPLSEHGADVVKRLDIN